MQQAPPAYNPSMMSGPSGPNLPTTTSAHAFMPNPGSNQFMGSYASGGPHIPPHTSALGSALSGNPNAPPMSMFQPGGYGQGGGPGPQMMPYGGPGQMGPGGPMGNFPQPPGMMPMPPRPGFGPMGGHPKMG